MQDQAKPPRFHHLVNRLWTRRPVSTNVTSVVADPEGTRSRLLSDFLSLRLGVQLLSIKDRQTGDLYSYILACPESVVCTRFATPHLSLYSSWINDVFSSQTDRDRDLKAGRHDISAPTGTKVSPCALLNFPPVIGVFHVFAVRQTAAVPCPSAAASGNFWRRDSPGVRPKSPLGTPTQASGLIVG